MKVGRFCKSLQISSIWYSRSQYAHTYTQFLVRRHFRNSAAHSLIRCRNFSLAWPMHTKAQTYAHAYNSCSRAIDFLSCPYTTAFGAGMEHHYRISIPLIVEIQRSFNDSQLLVFSLVFIRRSCFLVSPECCE